MTIGAYMVDISDPQEWDYTGTSVIPVDQHSLPRCNLFYIGGNTPHVWNVKQVHNQSNDYRLPCWVHGPGADGKADATEAMRLAHDVYGAPKGIRICIDMEDRIDHAYTEAFADELITAGDLYVIYGSKSSVTMNYVLPDSVIDANWGDGVTVDRHIDDGFLGTQYANATMLGHPFDMSALTSITGFWNIHVKAPEPPPPPPPPPPVLEPEPIRVNISLVSLDDGVTWDVRVV